MHEPTGQPREPPDPTESFWARRSLNTSVILLASALLAAWVFLPLWQPLLLGVVFASALSEPHRRLSKRLWGRPYLGAAVMTVGGTLLIIGPLVALGSIAMQQAVAALDWIKHLVSSGQLSRALAPLPDALERMVRPQLERVPRMLTARDSASGEAGRWAIIQLQSAVATASEVAFGLGMMLITFFFVLGDGDRLVGWLKSVSPIGRSRTQELLTDFRVVSRSLVGSNVITGIVQAVVATTGYFIARAPQPIFFGLLTLLTSFIPTLGTAMVSVPLAGLLLLSGKTFGGLFLLAWATLAVGLIDNLLRPLLIRGDVDIHGAVIFFSFLGGIALFGLAGLVVGPMALSFFLTMLRFHARDVKHEALAGGK